MRLRQGIQTKQNGSPDGNATTQAARLRNITFNDTAEIKRLLASLFEEQVCRIPHNWRVSLSAFFSFDADSVPKLKGCPKAVKAGPKLVVEAGTLMDSRILDKAPKLT